MPFSLIGSLISSGFNMMDSQMARDANRDNMLLQSSLNRNQYLFERELESPEKQRELYEKAGLNPALLYGGAGSSIANGAGISGTTATATAPTNPVRITAPSMLELAQVRSVDEDTKGKEIDNQTRANRNYLDLLDKKAEIEEKLSKKDLNVAQAESYKKQLDEIDARIDLLNAKTKTEGTKQDLNVAQTATEGTEQEKNKAQARKTNAESKREETKVSFEKYLRNVPMELLNSPSGTAWAIGILIPQIVKSGIKDIDSFLDTLISKLGHGTTKEILEKSKQKIINWYNKLPDKVNIPENSLQQLYDILVF